MVFNRLTIGRRLSWFAALSMLALVAVAAPGAIAKPATPPGSVNVQLLAINDFHGTLEALPATASSGNRVGNLTDIDPNPAVTNNQCVAPTCYPAGGVAYLADAIKNLEATNPNRTLVVSAGDNIGATPLLSAAFHDEPTIEALNMLGLDISAVGNHEFDEGVTELLRMQNGGCHPVDGCQTGHTFAGADFQFLAANVVYKNNGKSIFPAYKMRSVGGAKIGFIGLTLEGTPLIVSANGIQSVNFLDEADSINAATAALKAKGVHTIVVLLHEGGAQSVGLTPSTIDTCTGFSGAVAGIVAQLDDEVDMVISGHTHNAYNCMLPNAAARTIPVSSASSFGRLVTDIDMTINRSTDQPTLISVDNNIVFRDNADADEAALVSYYKTAIAPIANAVVGSITADMGRSLTHLSAAGESDLGDVIADAQLAYTQSVGADLALMNPGGIRNDLAYLSSAVGEGDGNVTYGEAFAVQPFNNLVVTQDMTGAQIKAVLEQQWAACTPPGRSGGATVILQISGGFTYSYDSAQPCGSRISSLMLNATPLGMATTYQVTMNNFLADGGDSFPAFTAGTNRVYAADFDVDALAAYLGAYGPVAPGPMNRITKLP
ncbi:MAG: bifunctional metallophosphatase/5'-nucleotidase [Chloroflexota bacterium]